MSFEAGLHKININRLLCPSFEEEFAVPLYHDPHIYSYLVLWRYSYVEIFQHYYMYDADGTKKRR